MKTLIDTNVLIDAWDESSRKHKAAQVLIANLAVAGNAFINPVIWAEASQAFDSAEQTDTALSALHIYREDLPWESLYLAGSAFSLYLTRRKKSLLKTRTPLPDFFIGAHAATAGFAVATSDTQRIKSYFPQVAIIEP